VQDPSDAAIVGARVMLPDASQHVIRQVDTDGAGNFQFDGLAAGEYKIEIEHESFRTSQMKTVVTGYHAQVALVLTISVEEQQVNVRAESAVPVVGTEAGDNQNANTIDRSAPGH
jgi:hypothetical protein